jgi:HAD domain in Swiss Army Knife RNA repair proteins
VILAACLDSAAAPANLMPKAKEPTKSSVLRARPLLFVDIDGVISVFGFAPQAAPQGTWTQVDGIAHLLSADAARHLLALLAHYELVWCSGWEEKANEHLPHLLGLGPFPHLSFPFRPGSEHWKIESIESHARGRPLAWIDDDHNEACSRWAQRRGAPTLLVATDPARGLDDEAAARLVAWADALPSPDPG